ncbi:MAG: hypothetical protein KJ600_05045 [Nanoarchaeota archaeon]|nr:hypothetical protein [Nanoarchaeota archaeon]
MVNEQDADERLGESVYEQFGPDDSHSRLKKLLEFMIYFVGFLGTILTLPQAYKIWVTQSAVGEYITSWVALTLFTPFWILYGVLHKKKSLVMTYVVWFVVNVIVLIGIALYR